MDDEGVSVLTSYFDLALKILPSTDKRTVAHETLLAVSTAIGNSGKFTGIQQICERIVVAAKLPSLAVRIEDVRSCTAAVEDLNGITVGSNHDPCRDAAVGAFTHLSSIDL